MPALEIRTRQIAIDRLATILYSGGKYALRQIKPISAHKALVPITLFQNGSGGEL